MPYLIISLGLVGLAVVLYVLFTSPPGPYRDVMCTGCRSWYHPRHFACPACGCTESQRLP